MVPDSLINPYGHTAESEYPHTPVKMPNWTEHYTFYGYDLENEVGVHIHVGRLPADPRIWRSVMQVYLPGGEELLVAKYHGRDGDDRGPGAGPFKAVCIEPFKTWVMDFDGAMFNAKRSLQMREVMRDGTAEPVAWHMLLEAAGPLFGRNEDLLEGRSSSTFHSEQVCSMTGFLRYRDKYIRMRGVGVRDHSSGPRDYGPVVADIWFHGLFPSGTVVQTQVVRFEKAEYATAYIYRNDGNPIEVAELLEHPRVNDINTPPQSVSSDPLIDKDKQFRIRMKTKQGIEIVEAELLHAGVITYFAPVEEFLGTELRRPDGIQMCEAPVRLKLNGEVGAGIRERVCRTGTLFAPD
jgi:hypothetical protein